MAFDKFKARQKVVKQQMADNKVFVVGVALLLIFVVFQAITHKNDPEAIDYRNPEEYVQLEDAQSESKKAEQQNQAEEPHWRFYWSDLAILGIGSLICGTMIIQERRKARENL